MFALVLLNALKGHNRLARGNAPRISETNL